MSAEAKTNNYMRYIGIIFILVVALGVYLNYMYMAPVAINKEIHGIKFKASSAEMAKNVKIKIEGTYRRFVGRKVIEFNGTIKIEGTVFDYTKSTLKINNEGMASIEKEKSVMSVYFNDKLDNVAIKILEPDASGGYSFSISNGWIISAPSRDREEAVQLANDLFPQNQIKVK